LLNTFLFMKHIPQEKEATRDCDML
jgi:hypothetical protein